MLAIKLRDAAGRGSSASRGSRTPCDGAKNVTKAVINRQSQYKAPVTRDTAPKLRCFDGAKDVALPPPGFLVRKGAREWSKICN